MKNCVWYLILIIFLGLVFETRSDTEKSGYFRAIFMEAPQAERKWGSEKMDIVKFKVLPTSKRAPMAVYTIKKGLFIGQKIVDVRQQLGQPDGYFFNDTIIAYLIAPYTEKKKESWQLVFIPSENNKEIVGAVRIHKKCCYDIAPWAN